MSPLTVIQKMIRESQAGYFSITLNVCTSQILEHLLDRKESYIWIHQHRPNPVIEWWKTETPITKEKKIINASVRQMSFDIHLTIEEFLPIAGEFDSLSLSQMSKPVPGTLTLDRMNEQNLVPILKGNGLISRFFIPHAMEVAVFSTTDRDHLERVCEHPEVKKLIMV